MFVHDMKGFLLAVNEAAANALGYTVDEMRGKNLSELVAPDFGSKLEWYLTAIAEWNSHSGLMRMQTTEGEEVVWSYSNRVVSDFGADPYVLGHAHDITAQVMMEEALKVNEGKLQAALESEKNLSRVDFLTGIPNRRMFHQALTLEGKRSRRYGRPITLIYIDVDNFKHLNDHYGHATGDELLKMIGTTLETTVRSTDMAARLGGDEFAVLLPETDEPSAGVIVAKLQAKPASGDWAEGMAGDVQLWRGDVPDCAGFDGRDDQAGGRIYVRSEAWRQERRGFEGDRNCGEGRVTGERSTVESRK